MVYDVYESADNPLLAVMFIGEHNDMNRHDFLIFFGTPDIA